MGGTLSGRGRQAAKSLRQDPSGCGASIERGIARPRAGRSRLDGPPDGGRLPHVVVSDGEEARGETQFTLSVQLRYSVPSHPRLGTASIDEADGPAYPVVPDEQA